MYKSIAKVKSSAREGLKMLVSYVLRKVNYISWASHWMVNIKMSPRKYSIYLHSLTT